MTKENGIVRTLVFIAALAVVATTTLASADVVLLKDGRIIERPKIETVDKGVKVHFENGEVIVPKDMISDVIFEKGLAFEPKTEEEKAKAAKGLVPFEGRWEKRDRVAARLKKRIDARKESVEEIRRRSIWRNRWQEETKHFKFEYTVPPKIYEYYSGLFEAYYDLFAKTWKIKQPKDLGKLRVCFHTDIEKYNQIGGARGSLGYFRFVEPLELNCYYNRLNGYQTEQVIYHEVNHYLQLLMNRKFSMPHFPGESIAEYYGSGKFDAETKKLTIGHILEGRLSEVKMDITGGDMLGLKHMVTQGRGFYKHYNWGWTLVHFLMQDKGTKRGFEKFVKALVYGKKVKRVHQQANLMTVAPAEVWEQFKQALKLKTDDDVKQFEAAWHTFIKEEMHVTSSRGLEDAARHASRHGLRIKAKRLMREAIEAGSTSADLYRRYAGVLRMNGDDAESQKMLRKAIELAPLEASMYLALGMALFSDGEKEEGRKYMKLARELDPDDPYLGFDIEQALKKD